MSWASRMLAGAAAVAAAAVLASATPAGASVGRAADENEGTTTVILNPAVVPTLVELGVAPIAPGTLTAPDGVYQVAFPITNDPTKGLVYHSGGLDFAHAGGHNVAITRFIVNTTNGFLTADARVDGQWAGRLRIFRLGAAQPIGGSVPACAGIPAGLSLTQAAAAALGVPAARGTFVGDACVVPGAER